MLSSRFSLFKRSKPILPITDARPSPSGPSFVVRGSITIWNASIALIITIIMFVASILSIVASTLERLATTIDGFRAVLPSQVTQPIALDIAPESSESSILIPMPSPVFDPTRPRPATPTSAQKSHSGLPTYTIQPHSDVNSSQQIAMAFNIIKRLLIDGKPTDAAFRWLLVDRVPIGYVWMPASFAAVLPSAAKRHPCDVALDGERYGHLVLGDADPALQMTPPPRVDVSFPGPIHLDMSTDANLTDSAPININLGSSPVSYRDCCTGVPVTGEHSTPIKSTRTPSATQVGHTLTEPTTRTKLARRAATVYGAPADISLETTTSQPEEGVSSDGFVTLLLAPELNTSLDTSSSEHSILPKPVDAKLPYMISNPKTPTPPSPGSPMSELPRLPSSPSALLGTWSPPATFAYVDQSPSQGNTRPIVSNNQTPRARQPRQAGSKFSPSASSLGPVASSVSLFASQWTPPQNFEYHHQTPTLGSTRPIIPRNKRRSGRRISQSCLEVPKAVIKDTVCITRDQLPSANSARSMKRYGICYETQETVEKLASNLRGSVSDQVLYGSPRPMVY
ncbi:hypothetical protein RhiLY_09643 [Ceratobasidium sp. AG-Ba]|nr:hypothetical protein RhiLY_09643 [Ceratobasidium sp. AG-Ba]